MVVIVLMRRIVVSSWYDVLVFVFAITVILCLGDSNKQNISNRTQEIKSMVVNMLMDPAFLAIMCFPLKKVRLIFYFEKPFLENCLESLLIFFLF